MTAAPRPHDESERLQELYSFGVLDSASDDDFDSVLDLALTLTGAERGTISFVDSDRQWFKSRRGVEPRETSRDISFCAHGILSNELFIVSDARKDLRFADSPLVTGDPPVVFYAGAPLVTKSGHRIGMLCVHDSHPREMNETTRAALRELSRVVVRLLELSRERLRSSRLLAALNHRELNTLQVLSSMLALQGRRMSRECGQDLQWLLPMRDRLNATACLLQGLNLLSDHLTVSLHRDLLPILTDMFVTTDHYVELRDRLYFGEEDRRALYDHAYYLLVFWYEAATLLGDSGCEGKISVGFEVKGDIPLPEVRCSVGNAPEVVRSIESDLRFALLESVAPRLQGSFLVEYDRSRILCAVR